MIGRVKPPTRRPVTLADFDRLTESFRDNPVKAYDNLSNVLARFLLDSRFSSMTVGTHALAAEVRRLYGIKVTAIGLHYHSTGRHKTVGLPVALCLFWTMRSMVEAWEEQEKRAPGAATT